MRLILVLFCPEDVLCALYIELSWSILPQIKFSAANGFTPFHGAIFHAEKYAIIFIYIIETNVTYKIIAKSRVA